MISKEVLSTSIERGMLGLNKGIPHGYKKLTEFLPNIQQSTYYLMGGELGVGKSAITDDMFVYNPIDWYLENKNNTDIKLIIPYYSFEIPKKDKTVKYLARRIYRRYGVLLDVNYILSRGNNRVSQEHYELVKKELPVLDELEDILIMQDLPKNPTGIWNDLLKLAHENGTGIQQIDNGNYQFKEGVDYKPKNDNLYVIPVVDHIGLTKTEREFNKKQVIDKLSAYMIILRNKCNFSPVLVQQLNRSMSSSDRFKLDRVEPQLSDFKESGNTQED